MKKLLYGAVALTMALSAAPLPLLAQEEFIEEPVGLANELEVGSDTESEVAQITDRHEGTPRFYALNTDGEIEQSDAACMYRLYNPNSGEHFYTANVKEKNVLATSGWTLEGIGWFAPATSQTPVYRLYNPNAGDHHYTTSEREHDELVRIGWNDEGIGWYSADEQEGAPLFRSYNPNAKAGSHNYTLNENEYKSLEKGGWKSEGVAWYGLKPTAPSEDVMRELETNLLEYREKMTDAVDNDLQPGDLYACGVRISNILKSMESQFGDRRFAFQDGKLIGYSAPGSDSIYAAEIEEGKNVVVLQPAKRQLLVAEKVSDRLLDGKACFFSAGSTPSLYTSAAGELSEGMFNGPAMKFERYYTGYLWQNEFTYGPAKDNVMDGRMEMYTRNIQNLNGAPKSYRWHMTVRDAKAEATYKDGYYYVYETPDLSVYYDFLPQNLKFWYE